MLSSGPGRVSLNMAGHKISSLASSAHPRISSPPPGEGRAGSGHIPNRSGPTGEPKPGVPLVPPAVPWKCKHCRVAVAPGRTTCDACREHDLDELGRGEFDARESDTEIVL